ncbi:MAG: C4-dicarboxylate ABC transporter substrate-binding protein, partial [Alphaproteobacteria bacterium]|nr:C4-dicarboxylate ABC transporter substrate-binding protein [Alphaproteobacteria bacterium]
MKKLFFSIALGLAFLLNQPAAQAETKLRVTLQLPLKHHLGKNIAAFKAEVEKETGG